MWNVCVCVCVCVFVVGVIDDEERKNEIDIFTKDFVHFVKVLRRLWE